MPRLLRTTRHRPVASVGAPASRVPQHAPGADRVTPRIRNCPVAWRQRRCYPDGMRGPWELVGAPTGDYTFMATWRSILNITARYDARHGLSVVYVLFLVQQHISALTLVLRRDRAFLCFPTRGIKGVKNRP